MLSDNIVECVQFIKKQFLCCIPIKNIQWTNFVTFATWNVQEILINNTVNLDIVKRYPIRISYQVAFLKYLVNRLETENFDVNDCVYDALGRLVALVDRSEYYKHYTFDFQGSRILTLKENSNIISQGTTGLCSWQAALALSEWCLLNSEIFKDKIVLELGSGIGLTGLIVSLICKPKKYYFTDCHPAVLEVLRENVLLNVKNVIAAKSASKTLKIEVDNTRDLEIIDLPWEDVHLKSNKFNEVDIVLAADVVYDSSLFRSLCDAIKCLLFNGRCEKVYLACTIRNTNTLEEFLCHLGNNNLTYKELDLPDQNYFCWNTNLPIRLLEVKIYEEKEEKGTV